MINNKLIWVSLAALAVVILVISGAGSAQSASVDDCETEDCQQDALDESITRMMDRIGWETEQKDDRMMSTDKTVITTETEDGEIHVTGDVSPGETITILLPDGIAETDVIVNGEPVAPTDADGEIEVTVPEDGEVTIVIESEQVDHEISLTGSETSTEVSSSTVSTASSTTVSSSTSTSTST